jgi:hypothetical protein
MTIASDNTSSSHQLVKSTANSSRTVIILVIDWKQKRLGKLLFEKTNGILKTETNRGFFKLFP